MKEHQPERGMEAGQAAIDGAHLDRQTMGDALLKAEVLGLLVAQIARIDALVDAAEPATRRELAHALKGAARGVGAFPLAAAAEQLEADPQHRGNIQRLRAFMREAEAAVAAYAAARG